MELSQIRLLELVGVPDAVFSIPDYQRGYTWTWRQVREFWLDIMRAERGDWNHFAGTIFLKEKPKIGVLHEMEIIDGQQRITTAMLMLASLANRMEADRLSDLPDMPSSKELRSIYLASPTGAGAKLATRDEADAFGAIVLNGRTPPQTPDNLPRDPLALIEQDDALGQHESNLRYIERLMAQEGFDPMRFWEGLSRFTVITAELGADDDGQEVFESLNGKGVQLSLADMLRNYLLASKHMSEQQRLYETYWTDIEDIFAPDPGSRRIDNAMHGWLTIRFPKARAHSPEDLYSAFKRYVEDEYAGSPDDLLDELRSFSLVWAENYRYHGSKKFKSAPWAKNGAQTLTSGYALKQPDNPEYAAKLKAEASEIERYW